MTLTRETVKKLLANATPGPWYIQHETDSPELSIVDDRGFFVATAHTGVPDPGLSRWQTEPNAHLIISVHDIATALLAAWDERDVLLNRAFDEGQILAALCDCEAERDTLRAALDADDKMISEITEDVVRWRRRAEAAEILADAMEEEAHAHIKLWGYALRRTEAAEDENAELKLDAAARDIRIFELKEELDNAEAKLAERDAENARLRELVADVRYEALRTRGDNAYRDFHRFVINKLRAALNKEPNP